jgi:hypothetical protein
VGGGQGIERRESVTHVPGQSVTYVPGSSHAEEPFFKRERLSFVNVTVTTMGSSLERGTWGSSDVPRYGQPTHDFETGRTWSFAQHG